MRKLTFVLVALVAFLLVGPVAAGACGQPNCTHNNTYNQGGDGGTGVGVGVGIGVGKATSNANATAKGGSVVGSGNSHVNNHVSNTNLNANLNSNKASAYVGPISNRLSNDQRQSQGQGQDQGQGQALIDNSSLDFTVEGDDILYEAPDFPVNSAAPVFAGNCAQGISAQTHQLGVSVASGNSVCDFIAVAGAYIAGGDRTEAFRVLGKAEKAADWRFFFSRVRMVITLGIF